MIEYEKSNLANFRPTDENVYVYFDIIFRDRKYDETFDIIVDRTSYDGFQSNYAHVVEGLDWKNERSVMEQVKFIHLVPYNGCWLPRYCCCVSCMEDLDFFDDAYYYFKEGQLRKQLQYVKESIAPLGNAVLLIPFCADNKMSKDVWSNTFLPAIMDVFTNCDERCIIIAPLD